MNIGDFSGGKIVKECFLSTLGVIALLILKFFEKSLGARGDLQLCEPLSGYQRDLGPRFQDTLQKWAF